MKTVLTFVIGLLVGAVGALLIQRAAAPYLPESLGGGAEGAEGVVHAKRWEGETLLLTLVTPEGAILAKFSERVPEIDLLVDVDDQVTLAQRRYEPFADNPPIARVRKAEQLGPAPGEPLEEAGTLPEATAAAGEGMPPLPTEPAGETPEPEGAVPEPTAEPAAEEPPAAGEEGDAEPEVAEPEAEAPAEPPPAPTPA